jgi:hypothetical protein
MVSFFTRIDEDDKKKLYWKSIFFLSSLTYNFDQLKKVSQSTHMMAKLT